MILRDKIWDISAARIFKTLVIIVINYMYKEDTICDLSMKVWVIKTKINSLLEILS